MGCQEHQPKIGHCRLTAGRRCGSSWSENFISNTLLHSHLKSLPSKDVMYGPFSHSASYVHTPISEDMRSEVRAIVEMLPIF